MIPAHHQRACIAAALALGLHHPERRSLLWAGIPVRFQASLPVHTIPLDQLQSDLNGLLATPQIQGLAGPPILIWLSNAIALSEGRFEAEPLTRARERLAAPSLFAWRLFLVNATHRLSLVVECDPAWTVQMLIDEVVDRHGLKRVIWHDDFGRDRTRIAYTVENDTALLGPHETLADCASDGAALQLVITRQRLLEDEQPQHLRPAPLDDEEASAEVDAALAEQFHRVMGR